MDDSIIKVQLVIAIYELFCGWLLIVLLKKKMKKDVNYKQIIKNFWNVSEANKY